MTDPLGLAWVGEAVVRERAAAGGEPGWLLAERLDALRRYAELPLETNALFTLYVDLRAARLAELTPYAEVGEAAAPDARLPQGAAAFLHVREATVVARALSPAAAAAGVVVDTFRNVLQARPELLRAAIEGGATLPENDKFGQLARAASAVGVLVQVPAGVELDGPVVVRWSVGEGGRALVSRTVVALGRGAHAKLLEEQRDARPGGPAERDQSLWSGTLEVVLGEGATLDIAAEQDFGPATVAFVNRHATLERDSTLRWALAHVGGLLSKSRVDNRLVGRGATVRQVEIAFGGGAQLFDLTSFTRHIGQDTTGDLLSKGVFQDHARGYLKGLISIERSARGGDSFLGEFGMLLDKKARSVTIPSLEIDQPDVRRAGHASSVAPIDENQLFYLQSRGYPLDAARQAIVLAFLEPVVARIPLADAQDRLRDLLARKWFAGRARRTAVAAGQAATAA